MTKSNILDFMYADLVLDNQWSLAEQFCALIKQNQSDQAIISSFQSLRTAYLLETLTIFRSDPMSDLIDIEKVSDLKTQEELENSNKAIESVIFWTNLFCETK